MRRNSPNRLLLLTGSCCSILLVIGFLAMVRNARAAEPVAYQNDPTTLMMPIYAVPVSSSAAPQQLTKKELKRLTAIAESPEDHLKIARYYRAEADRLDAAAAGYEEAASAHRRGPYIKNLMSPTAAARYENLAKGFRDEAKSDRELATSQEQMAESAAETHSRY
jgi:hypothetical protein